jgi:hypothetical protein
VWGTVDLARAFDARGQATRLFNACPPSPTEPKKRNCSPSQSAVIDGLDADDEDYRNRSIVPYIAGGVGLILGTTLLVLYANSSNDSAALSPGLHVHPWVGYQSAGLYGTF